jgi:hypothetical protein
MMHDDDVVDAETAPLPVSAAEAMEQYRIQLEEAISDGEKSISPLLICGVKGGVIAVDTREGVLEGLFALRAAITLGRCPKPDWMMFMSDAYVLHTETEDPQAAADELSGNLEKLFLAGDPRVAEELSGFCICPDGPSWDASWRYTRDENNEIQWGKLETRRPNRSGGDIRTAMLAILSMPPSRDNEFRPLGTTRDIIN